MTFFSDRNLAIVLIRMLNAYDQDHQLIHQDDDRRFKSDSTDIEIIQILGKESPKPILLTADMYKNPGERTALAASGLTVVFFKSGFNSQSFHTQAVKILNIWPEIVNLTIRCREPTAFEIKPVAKKVDRLCKTSDLKG